jgi:hypothetical protein
MDAIRIFDGTVRQQLALLKASSDYAQIIIEVKDQIRAKGYSLSGAFVRGRLREIPRRGYMQGHQ